MQIKERVERIRIIRGIWMEHLSIALWFGAAPHVNLSNQFRDRTFVPPPGKVQKWRHRCKWISHVKRQ